MTHIYAVYKTHLRTKDSHKLKGKGWKKILHANGKGKKKAVVAIFISNKMDFKIKPITRDKGGHYIILKGSI